MAAPSCRCRGEPGSINWLAFDREGTLWLATSRAELHALHPARLATVSDGLPDPIVYPVYEDRDGTIWAGGGGYLALSPARSHTLPRPAPHPWTGARTSSPSCATARGPSGWAPPAGCTLGPDGLAPAGDGRLRDRSVRALFESCAATSGPARRRGSSTAGPSPRAGAGAGCGPRDGLPFPWVRVIRETPDGALWFGTNGGGVFRLKDGRFTVIDHTRGLSSDLVRALWLSPDGHLWIGTENRGLNRLDLASVDAPGGPRVAAIGERRGLYSNGIHQIVPDGLGNLWMSTNHGLFRARLADLNAAADGALGRVETVAYTERDGMATREANGSVQDAGLRDRAGRIWFPTQAGLVRLDPRELLRRRPPPPVHVEGLQIGAEEVPFAGDRRRLGPAQRSFAMVFTAPSFLAPERQRFRYRLVPYDHGWIDAGERREAVYTKVPPGTYRFEVLASGPDGGWSPRPAAVTLEVVPRFWETAWFLAFSGLASLALVTGGLAALARLRGARQRSRQQQLERLVEERTATIAAQAEKLRELDGLKSQFFANISHELRTPLTLTLGPLQDALDGRFGGLRGDLAEQLEVAARNARRLLSLVDQLLDVARLDAGRLRLRLRRGDLAAAVRLRVEAFLPLAERQGIDLSLGAPSEPVEVWFDEVQIEKVLDNLLGNALKFTPRGGRVHVEVSPLDDGRVSFSVQDSGPGHPAPTSSNASSSASTRWRRPRGGAGRARASASPSPGNWSRCTAARSRPRAPAGREPASPSPCGAGASTSPPSFSTVRRRSANGGPPAPLRSRRPLPTSP